MQRLAVGGMAEVFLARRPGPQGWQKRVALKRILPHLARQPDFVAMFLDEARLAARLEHPHIVHIHDFGVDGDAYYLAMEYVCGEDLAALVRRANELGQPLPVSDVATILVAACEALHYAHEQGIVHRDVTPANLLVSYDGVVKLADFGIAKSPAAVARAQTNAGTLKGKIPYMSPEQARAMPLDRRSDLFSLGVVAWELFTGRRLFHRRDELDMLRAVQTCDVPSLAQVRADVPPALVAAIEKALAAPAEGRWSSAAELGQALSAWLAASGEPPSKARVAATMARLFGADAAARRLAAVNAPSEATAADRTLPPPGPRARWAPLRLLGPVLALLLSAGGLLFGLRSPHAHRTVSASVALPTAAPAPPPALAPPSLPPAFAAPAPAPHVERTPRGTPRRHDRQRRARSGGL